MLIVIMYFGFYLFLNVKIKQKRKYINNVFIYFGCKHVNKANMVANLIKKINLTKFWIKIIKKLLKTKLIINI